LTDKNTLKYIQRTVNLLTQDKKEKIELTSPSKSSKQKQSNSDESKDA